MDLSTAMQGLDHRIDDYIDRHWGDVLSDLSSLVSVESVEDLGAVQAGAPYGPGPREALSRALRIAERMGLDAHDMDGYIGYADLKGKSDGQIAIIGHVDVVPAGPGWSFEPFALTRKDGYLVGRGVSDDKGPVTVALHALGLWAELGAELPYTVRFIFGANEETGMQDVVRYRQAQPDPLFLFTPDAEFPVCYGEKGIANFVLESPDLSGGAIRDIEGGVAANAVPGLARAVVELGVGAPAPAAPDGVEVEMLGEGVARVTAHGRSAHASTPDLGRNAIGVLASFLLGLGALSPRESEFVSLVGAAAGSTSGAALGIDCEDEHFGPLTMACTMISMEGTRIRQTLDVRYPTAVDSQGILARIERAARACGASASIAMDKPVFLMDPGAPAVQALLGAYNEATGEDAEPFTMGGGTYARMFPNAVSFGPEKPWEDRPGWVGGMHGPDEGISEDLLKQALRIYARTIGRLMELEL